MLNIKIWVFGAYYRDYTVYCHIKIIYIMKLLNRILNNVALQFSNLKALINTQMKIIFKIETFWQEKKILNIK